VKIWTKVKSHVFYGPRCIIATAANLKKNHEAATNLQTNQTKTLSNMNNFALNTKYAVTPWKVALVEFQEYALQNHFTITIVILKRM